VQANGLAIAGESADNSVAAASRFWADFALRHYGRDPVEVDAPPTGLAVSPEEFFALLLRSCAGRGRGPGDPRVRFHVGQRQVIADVADFLPAASDDSVDGYFARLEDQLDNEPYLLVVERAQVVSRSIWKKAATFLAGLYEAAGILPGDVELEVFVGRYPNTVPGIHRELSGVFVSMVQGVKDIFVWPPAAKGLPLETARYSQAKASARRLCCAPGRLVYWPARHWHVGECPAGPTAGLHLAVLEQQPSIQDLVGTAVGELESASGSAAGLPWPGATTHEVGLPQRYEEVLRAIAGSFADAAVVRDRLVAEWLRRRTGLGFTALPPGDSECAIGEDHLVETDSVLPILLADRDGASSWLAADGRVARLPSTPALTRLIDLLNSGEPISARAALALTTARADHDVVQRAMSLLASWRALKVSAITR